MTRYVALLRGINVGGRNKVAMAELRELLAGLGHTEVKTHLQSGNAVFTAEPADTRLLGEAISAAIHDRLGLDLKVMVRSADEMRAVVEANPLKVENPARFLVYFLSAEPDPGTLAELEPEKYLPEEMHAHGRELYLSFPDGIRDAKLPIVLGRRLKVDATGRNWNTVTKLLALAEG